MNKPTNPPKLPLRFFRWFCHPDYREDIEGDLLERFEKRAEERGAHGARLWFAIQVLLLLRPEIIRPIEGVRYLNNYGMLKNHLKIALRSIKRHKVNSTINVLGLTLAICTSLVIFTVTNYDLSFDTFHPDVDRIYRVAGEVTESTGDKLTFGNIPFPVSQLAASEISGLEEVAGIIPYNAKITVPNGLEPPKEFDSGLAGTRQVTTAITGPEYFKIFKYDWLAGKPGDLANPLSVVITDARAYQYFGHEPLNAIIGRRIIYDDSLVVSVAGIVKSWEKNSDLAFTDFISKSTLQNRLLKNKKNTSSWGREGMNTWTFIKLSNDNTPELAGEQLATLVRKHGDPAITLKLLMEPLTAIHFNSNIIENPIRTASLPTLYSLIGIAAFILLLAMLNFINLSTAQSFQRAKEMGVRKMLGGSKGSLVFQFLTETLVIVFTSTILAAVLVDPALQAFHTFIPDGVAFHFFEPTTVLFLVSVSVATAVLAGWYPAWVLSSKLPSLGLRGISGGRDGDKWLFRRGLVGFQFVVSMVFIIGSIVTSKQLKYAQTKDLGFTAERVVNFDTPRGENPSKVGVLAQKIRQIPGVENVALQWLPPMTGNSRGMKLKYESTDEQDFWVTQVAGNEEYIPLYRIRLLAGRNLTPTDRVNELVINESLAGMMGVKTPEDALGKTLYWNDQPYPVVGVVADFHTASLHDPITPLCIINRPDREGGIAVKLTSSQDDDVNAIILAMQKEWEEVYPATAFSFLFYEELLAALYEKDRQTGMLINTSMLLAIFISCIGLFGLTLYSAQKRAKEISIRKVLGATVENIIAMLSREFVVLIIVAFIIASPVAWYLMDRWLNSFAYRTSISWWVFALTGLATLLMALATISLQALKAALANPVKYLRNE